MLILRVDSRHWLVQQQGGSNTGVVIETNLVDARWTSWKRRNRTSRASQTHLSRMPASRGMLALQAQTVSRSYSATMGSRTIWTTLSRGWPDSACLLVAPLD